MSTQHKALLILLTQAICNNSNNRAFYISQEILYHKSQNN